MSDMQKLMAVGKELGFDGGELQKFVREQQEQERIERAAKRTEDQQMREAEQKKLEAELEQKKIEKEAEMEQKKIDAELEKLRIQAELDKKRSDDETKRIEAQRNGAATGGGGAKCPKLPNFVDGKDSLDAYLERFKRFATNHKWPKETWASNLSALLTGKALDVYSRLSTDHANNYDELEKSLLERYDLTSEGFRKKLRESVADEMESPAQFITRLESYLYKWMETTGIQKDFKGLAELILMEQFIQTCNLDLATFLKERACKDLETLGKFANQYLEAHGKQMKDFSKKSNQMKNKSSASDQQTSKLFCTFCKKAGHDSNNCRNKNKDQDQVKTLRCLFCNKLGHVSQNCYVRKQKEVGAGAGYIQPNTETRRCFFCDQVGHLQRDCRAKYEKEKQQKGGCAETEEKEPGGAGLIEDPSSMCSCFNGDTVSLACGKQMQVMIGACNKPGGSAKMPVTSGRIGQHTVQTLRDTGCSGVVVKKKFVQNDQLTGKTKYIVRIDNSLLRVPVAKITVTTPYLEGEVEALVLEDALYDLIIGNVPGARDPDDPNEDWSGLEKAGATETRAQAKRGNIISPLKVPGEPDKKITVDILIKLQAEDKGLDKMRKMTEPKKRGNGTSWFLEEQKILYRVFHSPKYNQGLPVKQVVVPKPLREQVMCLAHDSIMGGHLAVKKTVDRILTIFYWPDIHGDVSRYCRSCDICQRTVSKGKVKKVPLGKLPIIDVPFKRMSFDLTGPVFPASERGYRYMLVGIDHASRYPDVVPLKNISTEAVAEAFVDIFSRVGIPNEILTDLGTQFVSEVMKEVTRLLSMKQLTSTPYHPICNGLVEKFNSTLKMMLKRLCSERPKDWDRYISALLFAYREVPQESTGFSPFELLFGRTVKGSMQILRELWTTEIDEDEVKTSYQYVVDLREKLETTLEIAHQNLEKAQIRYKKYYDKKARGRKLKAGDLVLILLPTDNNKLLMQWKGPFEVKEVLGDNDYRVDVKGKVRTYHINLLKEYIQRKEEHKATSVLEKAGAAIIECEEGCSSIEDDEHLLEFTRLEAKETYKDVKISEDLTSEQQKEVRELICEFKEIFSDLPGKTNLVEHKIELTNDEPVRLKPYPIPYSVRESLKKDVDQMLKMGIIRKSSSPHSSPTVIVKKPDGSDRVCIDYRRINSNTLFDCEPGTKPQDIFATVGKDKIYSKFDMTKGYWQIPMRKEDIEKTAFVTPDGSYDFLMMPFGLLNSQSSYNKMMRKMLFGLLNIDHYVDDCLVHTETWEEHLKTLRQFFQRVKEAGLTIRPSKCQIGFSSLDFVGHEIGKGEISLQEDNMKKIQDAPRPETKKQVRSFLGLTGFYREYIPNYAAIAVPLTDLTKKGQPNRVEWGDAQEKAYLTLKHLLVSKPVLRLPDLNKQYVLRTDASDVGLGAVLMQQFEDGLFPVAYASKKLLPREQAYSTMEKECLAIVWAVKKFMVYLYGNPFILQTDHQPLVYLNRTKFINDRIMRWAMFLQSYRIKIMAIKGSENVGADFLSRVN